MNLLQKKRRPTLAVHKFSSCDGCQLALLNLGEGLLELAGLVDIVHFAEAGPCAEHATVDIALVEGSISTPEDIKRIQAVRQQSHILVALGACATSGGLQALRNLHAGSADWMGSLYPMPECISLLDESSPIADHVKVDHRLWGCPVESGQLLGVVRDLLSGVSPREELQPLCMECKRRGISCVMVNGGQPCMGPVTRAGCGALCPRLGRACYACFGPAERVNHQALGERFAAQGLDSPSITRRFHFINSCAPGFREAGEDGQ